VHLSRLVTLSRVDLLQVYSTFQDTVVELTFKNSLKSDLSNLEFDTSIIEDCSFVCRVCC